MKFKKGDIVVFKEDAWGGVTKVKAGTLAKVVKGDYRWMSNMLIDVNILDKKGNEVEHAEGCFTWRFKFAEDKRI